MRPVERGDLADEFAAWRVWTIRDDTVAQEWLLVRRTSQGTCGYTLSTAPPDTPLERPAHLRCRRCWVERANQDAKSEAGWDGLQAQRYRAWEHNLARLTGMAPCRIRPHTGAMMKARDDSRPIRVDLAAESVIILPGSTTTPGRTEPAYIFEG